MKAGQALGLLAGMGALSALGRGADLRGNRFTGLLDMIDGGGGGKSGDRFEGGGLLSMLSNLFAKPYEAQQRVEDIAARAATRNTTPSTTGGSEPMLIQPLLDAAPVGTGNPLVDRIIEDRKEQVVMDQTVVPSVTTPNLTDAQKEAIVMSQALKQSPEAQGILAQPQVATQVQDTLFADKGTFSATDAPKIQSDPMGLLTPNMPTKSALEVPSAPNVMLDSPRPPNENAVMLQKLAGTVPQGVGELTRQSYVDYVLAGGRLPYGEYEKTTPEYLATQQLSEQYDTFYMMPIEEQMRLINDRADMIRRATPKNVPFTGPAF